MPSGPAVSGVSEDVSPSPQLTATAQVSVPGSVNEPRSSALVAPSSAVWSAAAVTTGATFAIATMITFSESVVLAPSESATLILTSAVAGPSGKVHLNEPPAAVAA